MPDVLDPEPTDKRTSEWKSWKARQAVPMESGLSPAPFTVSAHEAATFFGYFLAGLAASGVPKGQDGSTWLMAAKEAFHNFRALMAWTQTGQDVRDYEAREARQREAAERQARIEAEDAAGAAALLAKARAAHGDKVPAPVGS